VEVNLAGKDFLTLSKKKWTFHRLLAFGFKKKDAILTGQITSS
jgi:hypothetical protein